jgi:hypothetical protein
VAGAFKLHGGTLRRTPRNGQFRGISQVFTFLREQREGGVPVNTPNQLQTETLQARAVWLQRPTLTVHTQAGNYRAATRVLDELRRSRAGLFGHTFPTVFVGTYVVKFFGPRFGGADCLQFERSVHLNALSNLRSTRVPRLVVDGHLFGKRLVLVERRAILPN